MRPTPAISIILPIYNGEKYLRECLDSVLAQSFANYELIIWDDKSTDSSMEIVETYHDERIRRYANKRNQGLFKTLNLCIRQAKAPLIRLWSQDDVMKLNCLEVEAEFNRQHPEIGLSYCAVDYIDHTSNVFLQAPHDSTPEIIPPKFADLIMFYHGSIAGNIANVMLRKEVLDRVGYFCEEMIIAGDFEMWVRTSAQYPLGRIREPLVFLRSHTGQFSRQANSMPICMAEEQTIYNTLLERLPTELFKYGQRYNLLRRYPRYIHHTVRCLLAGDYVNAFKSYHQFRKGRHPVIPVMFWLLTANQRLFKMKPKYPKDIIEKYGYV